MATEVAIERSIKAMWNHHADPLSLGQLAETAFYSKFHYSRMFNEATGTSPGRFLAAIRLFMAKRHLLETAASVSDITYRVGYNSLGTFTSRFTRSVGIAPTRYRFLARCGMPPLTLPPPRPATGCPLWPDDCTSRQTSARSGSMWVRSAPRSWRDCRAPATFWTSAARSA